MPTGTTLLLIWRSQAKVVANMLTRNIRSASFPRTKKCWGNPSLFAGIPTIFPVILGQQSKMELLYQEKERDPLSQWGADWLGPSHLFDNLDKFYEKNYLIFVFFMCNTSVFDPFCIAKCIFFKTRASIPVLILKSVFCNEPCVYKNSKKQNM